MKAFEIVDSVCAGQVPVFEQAAEHHSPGGMYYWPAPHPIIQGIGLKEPTHQDGYSLAVAAHEAFHAKRAMEGVPFYRLLPSMLTGRQNVEEELIVNAEARAWLMPRLSTDEDRRLAEQCFYASESSYVDDFYSLAGSGLRNLDHAPLPSRTVGSFKQMILNEVLGIDQQPVQTEEDLLQGLFNHSFGASGDTDGDS